MSYAMTRAVLANVLTREEFTWDRSQAIRPARFFPEPVDWMSRDEERCGLQAWSNNRRDQRPSRWLPCLFPLR